MDHGADCEREDDLSKRLVPEKPSLRLLYSAFQQKNRVSLQQL